MKTSNEKTKDLKAKNQKICASVTHARRVVIKLGSRVIVTEQGKPELQRMRSIVRDVIALRKQGIEVIIVSSGAIGTGMEALGLTKKPTTLPELQMAAAVGQSKLMTRYDQLFGKVGYTVAQVLLTHDGLKDRERHLNTRNTFMALLRNGVIPIVNENDTVSVDEIKFGDNDQLASLVTMLVEADVLVLLSSTNGLKNLNTKRQGRIPYIDKITPSILELAKGKGSELSTGGMKSKLEAAQMVVNAGALAIIADGRSRGVIADIFKGKDVGTRIGKISDQNGFKISSKKRWIAFYHRAEGAVAINACAVTAVCKKGSSLLAVGIDGVSGEFDSGAVINVKNSAGDVIARGLTAYSSAEIKKIKGKHTSEIKGILGQRFFEEVIHRDNMVLLVEGNEI